MIRYARKVYYYETDKMGIVHHSNYIRYMEEARVAAMDEIGCGFRSLEEKGFSSPVVEVECRYLQPLRFDDEFTVGVRGRCSTSAVFELFYEITCGDALCATGRSSHCFVKNGRPVNLKKEMKDFVYALERTKEDDNE